MSVDEIVDYCWWYLEHLDLLLIPAAIFDVVVWIAIAIYLKKRHAIGRRGAPTADRPPQGSVPSLTVSGQPR